jgi:uncharacterized protein YqeY
MSELATRIQKDLVKAMKEKNELALSVLRMVKSSVQMAQVDKGKDKALTEEDITAIIRRLIKQRNEAAEMYKSGGASDRAERELAEAKLLEGYLPAQLEDGELAAIVKEVAESVKASGMKDMGKVMGRAIAAVAGRADGKRVRAAVEQYLKGLSQ